MTKTVPIIYIEPSGEEKEVQAEVGKNLLDIAHENNIELEGTRDGQLLLVVTMNECVVSVYKILYLSRAYFVDSYRRLWRRTGVRHLSLDF